MSIYKRGKTYSYNLWFRGRHVQGSCKTSNRKLAKEIESEVRVRLARGHWSLDPKPDPTLKELFDRLEEDFKSREKWSVKQSSNLKLARQMFPPESKASSISSDDVRHYVIKKQKKGQKQKKGRRPGTINRMVLLLSQAFRLAELTPPKVKPLSEKNNARKGFFEADQFARVLEYLPKDLHDFCQLAYTIGWRKGEIAGMTWRNVEPDRIVLYADQTKNEDPRSVPLNIAGLRDIIERRRKLRHSRFDNLDEPVFHRGDGRPIQEFRKTWARACKAAGVPRLFHDFRRTAVRNLRKAGVPENVAMSITGHKTRKVFDRYNIVGPDDKHDAMQKLGAFLETEAAKVSPIRVANV